jgi:hypothetical protein
MSLKDTAVQAIIGLATFVVMILIALISAFNWEPTADANVRFFVNDTQKDSASFPISAGTRELMVYETLDDVVAGVHGVAYRITYCRGETCYRIINAEHVTFTAKNAYNGRIYNFPGRVIGNTRFRVNRVSGFQRNSNLRLIVN